MAGEALGGKQRLHIAGEIGIGLSGGARGKSNSDRDAQPTDSTHGADSIAECAGKKTRLALSRLKFPAR